MDVDLIQVPWDSGHRARRMGQGPLELADSGLVESLTGRGHGVRLHTVEPDLALPTENAAAFALAAGISRRVDAAVRGGRFPLVLSGNCISCLGAVAGLGGAPGVVWFDAHADFNTPETTTSGFLDGMALAVLTGRCWEGMARRIPGFVAVPDAGVVMVGARALDPVEERALAASGVRRVDSDGAGKAGIEKRLAAALDGLAPPVDVYVHVDLDVLDPGEGRANAFAAPGGLGLDELLACIGRVAAYGPIRAAALTAYDPEVDTGRRVRKAGFQVAAALVDAAAGA